MVRSYNFEGKKIMENFNISTNREESSEEVVNFNGCTRKIVDITFYLIKRKYGWCHETKREKKKRLKRWKTEEVDDEIRPNNEYSMLVNCSHFPFNSCLGYRDTYSGEEDYKEEVVKYNRLERKKITVRVYRIYTNNPFRFYKSDIDMVWMREYEEKHIRERIKMWGDKFRLIK